MRSGGGLGESIIGSIHGSVTVEQGLTLLHMPASRGHFFVGHVG
jgi:hypothetical protein